MRIFRGIVAASTAVLVASSGVLVASPAASAATAQEELVQVLRATDELAQDALEVRIRGFAAPGLPPYSGTTVLGQTSWGFTMWQSDTAGSLQAFGDGSTMGFTVEALGRELGRYGKPARTLFERGVEAAGVSDDSWVVLEGNPEQRVAPAMSPIDEIPVGRDLFLSDLFRFIEAQVATADSVTARTGSGDRVVYTVRVAGVRSAISITTQAGLVTKYSNRAKGGFSFDVLGLGDAVTVPDFAAVVPADPAQSEAVFGYASSLVELAALTDAVATLAPSLVPPGGRLTTTQMVQAVRELTAGRAEFAVAPSKSLVRVRFVGEDLVSSGFPEPCMTLRVSRGAVSVGVCS